MLDFLRGYVLGEQLYESAHTLVYRGHHEQEGLPVIIKALRSARPSPRVLARFKREFELARGLNLAGVVRPLALVQHSGRAAIVMNDIGAESLKSFLAHEPLDLSKKLTLMRQLAQILGEVHRCNIIHKDINPSNIIIQPQTLELKLIDFGLATELSHESAAPRTLHGAEGTLRYISPEQTGRMNRPIDHRSDLYSLGITFYELLTGAVPFEATDAVELVHSHIAREPVPPLQLVPEVSQTVSSMVLKLLAKTAEERYQSAYGLEIDLSTCLKSLSTEGRIRDFIPGQSDVSDKFRLTQKFYGRDVELGALLETFERVSRGRAELTLVAGSSGVGKSTLINEVCRPVLRKRGYFVSGKFDQLSRDIPYASLIQAFQDLMRQFLSEPEQQLAMWRGKLLAALGPNGRVIIDVIPEVELVIGPQPPVPSLPPAESLNRLTFAFQSFVRCFASEEHPLVLFLDDLQWADGPSLHLLHHLVTDTELRHLLILGAYRDSEVTSAHPLAVVLEALRKVGASVNTLKLKPLGLAHVQQLIDDTLRDSSGDTRSLAELTHAKTAGNPFFLSQFLQSLAERGLLRFDLREGRWQWSLEEISLRDSTDNVVELMASKIERLSVQAQQMLQLAACIGNSFNLTTLALVAEQPLTHTTEVLGEALREGLLVPMGEAYGLVQDASYRFLHDRVQQAAYQLIAEDSRRHIHLRIGQQLLRGSTLAGTLEEHLFTIVNQLDLGSQLVISPEERAELARLNLRAGKKAKASAAYEPARRYFEAGLHLLPDGSFAERYPLAFELHAEAMEAAYLTTELARAEELFRIALAHAHAVLEKVRILETQILFHSARGEYPETIQIGAEALELLGTPLPHDIHNMSDALSMVDATAALLGDQPTRTLVDLPEMTDAVQFAALRILVILTSPIYISQPLLFMPVVCKMVRLCFEHGNSSLAPFAYAEYGVVRSVWGDVTTGHQFSELAFKIIERFDAQAIRPKVCLLVGGFIRPWHTHLRESQALLYEGLRLGLESGDLETVGNSAAVLVSALLYVGEPLDVVVREVKRLVLLMAQVKQEHQQLFGAVMHQTALNLTGVAQSPQRLVGEGFNEDEMLPGLIARRDGNVIALLCTSKCMLAYLLGDYSAALSAVGAAEPWLGTRTAHIASVQLNLYHSLTLLAAARAQDGDQRKEYLAKVARNQEELKCWGERALANCMHKYQLVEAERARTQGHVPDALKLYEQAIRGAAQHGYVQEEALAYELAAEFYLSLGVQKISAMYLGEARYAYARWGATAKVTAMEQRHPAVLWREVPAPSSSFHPRVSSLSMTGSQGAEIDLATVMKAARALSREIVLDNLVSNLMHILLENAGAQRGFLLFPEAGGLIIKAELDMSQTDVLMHDSRPLTHEVLLSAAIVNYVYRTKETVVLSDAAHEGSFMSEPYVATHQPRSVLCSPLIDRGTITAIIYLENNLAVGAFTTDRLEVLRLLSSQATLSLHNARLYEDLAKASQRLQTTNETLEEYNRTLEQKVESRTREIQAKNTELGSALQQLRDMQQQLIVKEKLASLGTLTAGVAHEIKNPLNFINNFSELSLDLIAEVTEQLGAQQSHIPKGMANAVQDTLEMLHQNVSKINEHGQRADRIVKGMLLHSPGASSVREQTDLNLVLTQSANLAYQSFCRKSPGFSAKVLMELDSNIGVMEIQPQEMSRVFINLVDNACYALKQKKNAEPGYSPTLRLQTRGMAGRVEVRIRDNGTGISQQAVAKLFNPFFTTKPPGEGLGLGLSLSYDIVTRGHQGSLQVETVVGEFAEFILTLPLARQ